MSPADQFPSAVTAGVPAGFTASHAMPAWMQEIVPYGIFTTDRDLRVTSWNEWLVVRSGLAATAVIGRLLPEICPDLASRRLLSRYSRALDGEISVLSAALHKYLLPFPVTVPESGLMHMLQSARVAPLPDGEGIAGTITIIEDVTQREFQAGILSRQQEFDRLLSEALATLLQSTSPVAEMEGIFASVRLALRLDTHASYLFSADRQTLRLNAAVGFSPRQREAIAALELLPSDREALRAGTPPENFARSVHFAALHKIGLRGQWCLPLTVGDRAIGLVAFGSYQRDTIMASDLAVLERIARYVAIAIDRANRETETIAASRAKDNFLAALSHELRTPLNPVLLVASDGATNANLSPEVREAFRVIEKNVLLEARLIDDLLDLTRISHGKLTLQPRPLDIHASLRDAIQTVRAEMQERGLTLREDLARGSQTVNGDNDRLQQVFWNILKNAIKFTPRGGEIVVSSARPPNQTGVVIRISDTGVGMDPAELARAFEAFAQGDHAAPTGSHRFGGLGLGLAITRKLVEMHQGKIEATSAGKGRGSTFTIHLPLVTKAVAAPVKSVPGAVVGDPGVPGETASPRRILLVEDHGETRKTLTRLLERRGYHVVAVDSAQAAMREADAREFDLVLSDIGLPGDNGFSLMRKLHERHGLKGVALTGYGMQEDVRKSEEAGFLTHLTKPISVMLLERALEQSFAPAKS